MLFPSLFYFIFIFKKKLFVRAETPPNTPQRARIVAQQLERSNRTLDSPQRHRTPHHPVPPLIPPLNFNVPPPPPVVVAGDDPFALPAPAPEPVHFNGRQYRHLPQHLAEAIQNLAPVPAPLRGRGRGRGIAQAQTPPNPPVSYLFMYIQYIWSNISNSYKIWLPYLLYIKVKVLLMLNFLQILP
jgi:hypothetical protein